MGPRLFSRGNSLGCQSGRPKRTRLQWGRGFSAAEISRSEADRCRERWGFNGAAAFQPRKSALRRARPRWFGGASMGPRLFSRGNPVHRLQRPRGQLRLQWGRGFSAAEIRSTATSSTVASTRFNGAAAFQPRKWLGRPTREPARRKLQWGRGFSAAEIFSTHPEPARKSRASMGPRLFSRGNYNGAVPRACQNCSFNGAAAFQPRKFASCGSGASGDRASMGPRLFSRGNMRRRWKGRLNRMASMGPRLFSRGNICSR